MTTARQLFSLQELDLILDRVGGELTRAERELQNGLKTDQMESELKQLSDRLEDVQGQQTTQQQDAQTQRDRSAQLDEQLYSGDVTNPRDLASLEQEASRARQLVEQQEAALLELSLQSEECQARCAELEKELTESHAAWETRQAELQGQLQSLGQEQQTVESQRGSLVATLDAVEIQRYEGLRRAKGGVAVAKVERGLCHGCRMSLPTRDQQQVRHGRKIVLCSTCGRILCLG